MENEKQSSSFLKGLVVGLFAALLISVLAFVTVKVYLNYVNHKTQTQVSTGGDSSESQKSSTSVVTQNVTRKMELIEQVIDTYYYQEDIDQEELENGIYRGMVESLGDPYSAYYSAEELTEMTESIQGIFYGIGATLSLDEDTGFGIIKEVMSGTPAEEAGLKDGDLIYKVDGESTYGMDLQEIVSHVRGEENTQVVLTIVRTGADDYLEIPITRRKIEDNTVNATMYDNKIGYIQITEFDEVTTNQFKENLEMLQGDGMEALILDLRSNPGGSLSTVVDIAGMMLPKGLVVYTEDKNGKREEYYSDGKHELTIPMVVLVNGASASASEILSGAIKDYGIGTLMGTKTFGKGIVQRPITLSDGSAVKLTVSSYYTPKGNNIHGIGIEPDVECIFDANAYYDNRYDNQLEKAREYLSDKLGVEYVAPDTKPVAEEE